MYTNSELLDSVITEMYSLFKALISGNYTGFCAAFVDILSKLGSLREGLKKEEAEHKKCVDDLKKQLEYATTPETEPGGSVVGGETSHYNYDPRAEE